MLLKCPECGHRVSTQAKTCPSCGGPAPKPPISIVGPIILSTLLFMGLVSLCHTFDCKSPPPIPPSSGYVSRVEPSPAPEPVSAPPPRQYVIVTSQAANLRAGPGTAHEKTGRAISGDILEVLEEHGEWLKVFGETGEVWISASLTTGMISAEEAEKHQKFKRQTQALDKAARQLKAMGIETVVVRLELHEMIGNMLVVTISDAWFYQPEGVRLQVAQGLQRLWVQSLSLDDPDKARIRIVDQSGNRLAESGILCGSCVELK